MKWLVGCDPEIVLLNPNSGDFVSAEGLIPGDKLNPHKVKKGQIQVDGFAAEIGIDPASSEEEFADNVETVLEELRSFIPGYRLVFTDSVVFSDDVYMKQSEKGRLLGCDPDFDAHRKGAVNEPPVPDLSPFRTFGGHIHIGFGDGMDVDDPGMIADCIAVTKQMDWALGVPSVYLNPTSKRRVLCGKAGCFRPKHYGCEYRTPDNAWLRSRDSMKLMFSNCVRGMDELYKGNHYTQKYRATDFINKVSGRSGSQYSPSHIPDYLNVLGIKFLPPVPIELPKKKRSYPKIKKKNGEEIILEERDDRDEPEVA